MSKPHKYNVPNSNVVTTDTFSAWVNKTNEVIHDMGTSVVTVSANTQPDVQNGGVTVGNAHIEGILSANIFAAVEEIRGGTVSSPNTLDISSNVVIAEDATIDGELKLRGSSDKVLQIRNDSNTYRKLTVNISRSSSNINVLDISTTGIIPSSNTNIDLGSSTRNWRNIHVKDGSVANSVSIGNNLDVGNAVDITGRLDVRDDAYFDEMVTVADDLFVIGDGSIQGEFHVTDNATFGNTVTVSGESILNSNLSVATDTSIGRDLTVDRNATVTGNVVAQRHLTVSNTTSTRDISVSNSASITNNLSVSNNVTITRNVSVGGTIDVTGDSTLSSNVAVGKTLTVGNNAIITGTLNVSDNINTPKNVNANNITVTNLINSKDIAVSNSASITNNLSVSNNAIITKNLSSNNVTTSNDINVGRNAIISGNVTITRNLSSNNVTTSNDINVGRDLKVSRNTDITGNTTTTNLTAGSNIVGNILESVSDTKIGRDLTVSRNTTISGNVSASNMTASSNIGANHIKSTLDTSVGRNITVTGNVSANQHISGNNATFRGTTTSLGLISGSNGLSITGTANVSSNMNVGGNISSNGHITMSGTANKVLKVHDTGSTYRKLTVNLSRSSSNVNVIDISTAGIIPGSNVSYNLGSSAYQWSNVYTRNLISSGNVSATGNMTVGGTADITGNTRVRGNLAVDGTVSLSSNIALSVAESIIDDLTVNNTADFTFASIVSPLIPNNTWNLGSSINPWGTLYTSNVVVSGNVMSLANSTLKSNGSGSNITIPANNDGTLAVTSDIKNSTITITAGSGLKTGGNFTLNQSSNKTITLENDDKGSSQSIFKNFKAGANTVSAGNNNDTIEFVPGTNITITADPSGKKINIGSVAADLQDVTTRGNSTNRTISVTNATDSSSTSTGAMRISGGVGIGKKLYVGGSAIFSNTVTVSGKITGTATNADQASKLSTARKITLTGSVTGNTNFDGSGNVSIATGLHDKLDNISGLGTVNNDMIYFTGANTVTKVSTTAYGRGFLNLSNMADGRSKIGLGTVSTFNVTTSPTDTNSNRILKVGDFGQGKPIILTNSDDLDSINIPGFYAHSQGNRPANTPIDAAGSLIVINGDTGSLVQQIWIQRNSNSKYLRVKSDGGSWSSWDEFWHTGNFNPGNLASKNTAHIVNDTTSTLTVARGGTGGTNASSARSNLGLGNLATKNTANIVGDTTGTLSIGRGGTGATSASTARSNLGLGSVATESTVPITKGGTGGTTAATARSNLGLGSIATQDKVALVSDTTETLTVLRGGTGATTAAVAWTNLGGKAIGKMTGAANKIAYFTGTDALSTTDLTSHGRNLIATANVTATRSLLNIGSIATQNSNSVNITGGSIDGTNITGGSIDGITMDGGTY